MTTTGPSDVGGAGELTPAGSATTPSRTEDTTNLADVLERVLDKGVVIVGDIRVNLLDIELLTIKLRLVVAGVDTAKRMGIDWWETDSWLVGRAAHDDRRSLRDRVDRLERQLEAADPDGLPALEDAEDEEATR